MKWGYVVTGALLKYYLETCILKKSHAQPCEPETLAGIQALILTDTKRHEDPRHERTPRSEPDNWSGFKRSEPSLM